jgi:hypothetical protein
LGALICLALVGVVLVVVGLKAAVRNYTSATAKPVPRAQADPQQRKALEARWIELATAVRQRQSPPPFAISADDINLFFAGNKGMGGAVGFVITNGEVRAEFSAPLDKTGRPELKGRYLNGTAKVNINFADGWLTVGLGKVEANGRKIPDWLLKRFQRENWVQQLDKNRDMVNFFQEMDTIRVQGDKVVLTPLGARQ